MEIGSLAMSIGGFDAMHSNNPHPCQCVADCRHDCSARYKDFKASRSVTHHTRLKAKSTLKILDQDRYQR